MRGPDFGKRLFKLVMLPLLAGLVVAVTTAALVTRQLDREANARLEQRSQEIIAALSAVQLDVDQAVDVARGAINATPAKSIDRGLLASLPSISGLVSSIVVVDGNGNIAAASDPPLLLVQTLNSASGPASWNTKPTLLTGNHDSDSFRLGFGASTGRSDLFLYVEFLVTRSALHGAPTDVMFSLTAPLGEGADTALLQFGDKASGSTRVTHLSIGDRDATLTVQETQSPNTAIVWPVAMAAGIGAIALVATTRSMRQWRRDLRRLRDERILLDEALEQRRHVEAALGATSANLRTVLDSAPDAVAVVDPDDPHSCELLNRIELFGHSGETLRTRGIDVLIHDDDAQRLQHWWASRETHPRAAPSEIVFTGVHADGTRRDVRLRIAPLRRSSLDTRRRFLATVSDVTEQREQERRDAALRAELQRARHLESLGRLAGGIAHDFNNVLTAVRVNADLLRGQVDSQQSTHLEIIEAATQRAADLVRQLVAFARRDIGAPAPINLSDAVQRIDALLTSLAGTEIRIELDLRPYDCVTRIDPSQLDQLILNLGANSIQAMPLGGTLRITTAVGPRPIGDDNSLRALLVVSDTGIGMDAHVVEHAFEPFFTTKGEHGSGLGLATTYGIVSALGGDIDVDSRPGDGTTVTVSLPLDAEFAARTAPPLAPPVAPPGTVPNSRNRARPLVALIDDDPHILEPTAALLRDLGFEVVEADSGPSGLEVIARQSPDAVIADVAMPGMDGIGLAAVVGHEFPGVPVVLMTGDALGWFDHELSGCPHPLIPKPFTADELIGALRAAMAEEQP